MSAVRFCPQCSTPPFANARFCHACGAPLVPGAAAARGWQPTALGGGVLAFFLIAGLGIWTAILSPTPPRPGPGGPAGARPPTAADAGQPGDLPAGHPKVPIALPAEVKSFVADLAAKAKEKPRDVDTWLKLGQVNFRAAQLDPAYYADALTAFQHVLGIDAKNADALRGMANVHYDREEHKEAIPFYEGYLEQRPDDPSARTDLATMYFYTGDATRAVATYKDVIRRNPSFLQAHYNLAVTYHGQGDDRAALAELGVARGLATDDDVRKQVDEMIATLKGTPPAPPAVAEDGTRSPFQAAVERSLREHPIVGPKIVRFEWSTPGTGRMLVDNFPMAGMPPAVREKFTGRVADQLRGARDANGVEGPVRLDIADATSGDIMASVTP
jgi:hypothetical protein